jgi:hypothetical protein
MKKIYRENLFNFVYLTTNLINNKQYVGDHSTNNLNCSKTKNYLGTGKIILKSINKYGRKNFKRKILDDSFKTKQEAFDAQEKYIKEYNTLVPNGYNLSPKGGYGVPESYLNEETKQKIGKANKGKIHSKEFKENLRKIHTGLKQSKETIEKRTLKLIGKSHPCSIETRNKIGKGNKGKTQTEEAKEKIKNFQIGRIRSDETKAKISISKQKLNNDQIKEIKEKLKYIKVMEIAKEYNVGRGLIFKIKKSLK